MNLYYSIGLFLIILLGITFSGVAVIKVCIFLGRNFNLSSVSKYQFSDFQLIGFIFCCFLYVLLGLTHSLNLNNFLLPFVFLSALGLIIYFPKSILNKVNLPTPSLLVTVLFISPAILIGFAVALHPTSNWDAISYTLAIPKIHISENNLRYITEYGIFGAFPLYGEAALAFPMLFTKDEFLTQMLMSYFVIILLIKSYELFNSFEKNKIFFLMVALVSIAYSPISINNFGIAKVEICQAAFLLASLSALNCNSKINKWESQTLSFIFLGFAFGLKYTAIFFLPIYFMFYMRFMKGSSSKNYLISIGFASLLIFLLNLPWLINNYLIHCDPFFPNLSKWMTSCSYPEKSVEVVLKMIKESTVWSREFSWHGAHSLRGFYSLLKEAVGFSGIVLILVPAVLLVFIHSADAKFKNIVPIYLSATAVIIFMLFFSLWEFRYLYPALVILAITGALSLAFINRVLPATAIAIAIILGSITSLRTFLNQQQLIFQIPIDSIKAEKYRIDKIHLYWVAKYFNENTSKNDIIGFNWGVQPFYYLNNKYFFFHEWNLEGDLQFHLTQENFNRIINTKELNYLAWRDTDNSRYINPSISEEYHLKLNQFLDNLIESKRLVLIYKKDDVRIFEIKKGEQQ